jgi:lysophospholipase L1-like esterase
MIELLRPLGYMPGRHARTGPVNVRGLLALLFGVGAAALLAAGVELAYRRVETGRFDLPRSADQWALDPELLYRLNPENPETPGSFRGGTPASPQRARHRVVCLGESTTFGHGVATEQAWPAALGRELAGRDVEVINAGVPGYGSRQLERRYARELAALSADVVVLYLGWNRTGALLDPDGFVPAGVPRPSDGTLVSAWLRLQYALAHRSLLLRRALSRFAEAEAPLRPWRRDPFESAWVEDVRALLAEIESHGGRPLVVLYPALYHRGMSDAELALYRPRMWRRREFQPEMLDELARKHELLRQLATEGGVPVVDLQAALAEETGLPRLALFLDNMHPSVEGNRWLAGQLAPEVAALLDAPEAGAQPAR